MGTRGYCMIRYDKINSIGPTREHCQYYNLILTANFNFLRYIKIKMNCNLHYSQATTKKLFLNNFNKIESRTIIF